MLGKVVRRVSKLNNLNKSLFSPRITRHISWRDLNPFQYIQNGYQSVKGYWYGPITTDKEENQDGGGQQNTSSDGSNSIEVSTISDPVPVYLDLSSFQKDDEKDETLAKIQNLGKVSLLMVFRFRKYIIKIAGKYIKVLFDQYYEYLFLIIMFLLL